MGEREEMQHFLSFGEILFDCFQDGRHVLGGAPLNVAYHMACLGLSSSIISAVGDDELGRQAMKEVEDAGIDTSFISVLEDARTGRADIVLESGDARYTFNSPAAWDRIPLPDRLPEHVDCIYFGSLAQRDGCSRKALMELLDTVKADLVFFDVNMRKDFYNAGIIEWSLRKADVLKVNQDELPVICRLLDKDEEELVKDYGLKILLVTRGGDGSQAVLADGTIHHQKPSAHEVVDSVGAGDSLSAGFIASLLRNGDPARALRVGTMLADYVITRRGATPRYSPALLEQLEKEGIL